MFKILLLKGRRKGGFKPREMPVSGMPGALAARQSVDVENWNIIPSIATMMPLR